MEASPNQNIEPLREREKRLLEFIDYVLEQYDKSVEVSHHPIHERCNGAEPPYLDVKTELL